MIAVWVIFLVSLVPLPICYILNNQRWMVEPVTIVIVGVLVLALILLLPYLLVRRQKKPDFILYVMSLFMFSSMIDLITALEADGIIPELMSFYRKEGEAYLWTAYGMLSNYWDSVVHYGCCLWMLYCVNTGKSYRKVGLFWVGSMSNSLVVLVFGSIVGKFGVKYAVLLNVPYFVVPVWVGYRLLMTRPQQQLTVTSSPLSRLTDLVFVLYFMAAGCVDFIRAAAALGSKVELCVEYGWDHEPYLSDPVAYPKIQMMVYLLYFVPFYCCAINRLVYGGLTWLPDWALLFAGAATQGQFVHTGASIHYKTDAEFIVPDREHSRNIFWLLNIMLFVGPLLFALRENLRSSKVQRKLE